MTIDYDMAALIGFVCEAVLYGCYTIIFALAVYLKFSGPDGQLGVTFKRPLFIVTVFLYLLCTTHFALGFAHFCITLSTTGVEGFARFAKTIIGAGQILSLTDTMGDLILIYRCWVLWSKNYWVIIFPCLTLIGNLMGFGETLRIISHINENTQQAPAGLMPWGLCSFIVLICGNAIVTTLIVVRIWQLSPHKRCDMLGANFQRETGLGAIIIIIESGMLYLVAQIVFCILFAINHPAQDIVGSMAVQVYGIAPTLIFIRMYGLLNSRGQARGRRTPGSGGVSTPVAITTTVVFSDSTIMSTDPGPPDAIDMPKSIWKPNGGDLGSIVSSTDCTEITNTV